MQQHILCKCNIKYFFLLVLFYSSFFRLANAGSFDSTKTEISFSAFPIIMYDSDTGFGFGGKMIFKNYYQNDESFDLILFWSTKGEQWYKFTYSVPDFELRQGKAYPWALDINIEYLKIINSNFFGVGNNTPDNDFAFTNENLNLSIDLSHAFSPTLILGVSYNLALISLYDYQDSNTLLNKNTSGIGESHLAELRFDLKHDSRNSQINPSKGHKITMQYILSSSMFYSKWTYKILGFESAIYKSVLKKHILAARLFIQTLSGRPPIQALSTIGGGWTARGYKVDRFKDNALSLISLEYRFPIFKQLGGVVFEDMGRVYNSFKYLSVKDWHMDSGLGLRYYLDNFVVRMDVGLSNEGVRIYFNFGHVF